MWLDARSVKCKLIYCLKFAFFMQSHDSWFFLILLLLLFSVRVALVNNCVHKKTWRKWTHPKATLFSLPQVQGLSKHTQYACVYILSLLRIFPTIPNHLDPIWSTNDDNDMSQNVPNATDSRDKRVIKHILNWPVWLRFLRRGRPRRPRTCTCVRIEIQSSQSSFLFLLI